MQNFPYNIVLTSFRNLFNCKHFATIVKASGHYNMNYKV